MSTRRRVLKDGLGLAAVPFLLRRRKTNRAMTLRWSGHTWHVRSGGLGDPGPNRFNSSLVTVDDFGRLHMHIAKLGLTWQCSEIHLERALGFGTYTFTVL